MAKAWKEMSGTRRIEMHGQGPGPHYVDTIITFIGVEGADNLKADMPTLGDLYADILAGVNLDADYGDITLDGEPTVTQVSESHKLTEKKCMVTCRFRGYATE